MNELDPQLAALLRRAPVAPAALDEAHRQAVLLAARQAWFRQRARSRRNLLGLAAAAVFAAAIAGWTIRSLVDSPVQTAPPTMAVAERPGKVAERPAEVAERPAERKDLRRAAEPVAMAKSTAPPAPAAAPAPLAAAAALEADGAANAMRSEAGAAEPRAGRMVAAPAAAMALDSVAAPSPQGHLVVAQLVLEAAHGTRLTPATRQASLQAALDGLAGIDGAEAEALRTALRQAMQQR